MSGANCRGLGPVALLALGFVQVACARTARDTSADAAITDLPPADLPSPPADLLGTDQSGSAPVGEDLAADPAPVNAPEPARDASATETVRTDVVRLDAAARDLARADTIARFPSDAGASPGDGPVERAPACGSGAGACNDDPMVSAIWGTCQPEGTCACTAGYVVNPSTGRCRLPPQDASAIADADPLGCAGDFVACGCGCCEGFPPKNLACYYPTAGDTVAALRAADDAVRQSSSCRNATCNDVATQYFCCLPVAPVPTSDASYATDLFIGDSYQIITVSKSGSDCAQIRIRTALGGGGTGLIRVDVTPTRWAFMVGTFPTCGDAAAAGVSNGGLGSVSIHASGSDCLIDAHLTLFGLSSASDVTRVRMDVDGLVVKDFPATLCN